MPEHISFKSDTIELVGLLEPNSPDRGVVITHPHPLYGGDMTNTVVSTISEAYARREYSALRFNFRGVGASGGTHDDGQGEQQDVLAAVAYLKDRGVQSVDLVGYSFGAWVIAHAPIPADITRLILVSPPVAFMPFDQSLSLPTLTGVITGSRDDFAPPGDIEKEMPGWNPSAKLTVIPEADHFYSGCLQQLESAVIDQI